MNTTIKSMKNRLHPIFHQITKKIKIVNIYIYIYIYIYEKEGVFQISISRNQGKKIRKKSSHKYRRMIGRFVFQS
jgi:hypothetical protein